MYPQVAARDPPATCRRRPRPGRSRTPHRRLLRPSTGLNLPLLLRRRWALEILPPNPQPLLRHTFTTNRRSRGRLRGSVWGSEGGCTSRGPSVPLQSSGTRPSWSKKPPSEMRWGPAGARPAATPTPAFSFPDRRTGKNPQRRFPPPPVARRSLAASARISLT